MGAFSLMEKAGILRKASFLTSPVTSPLSLIYNGHCRIINNSGCRLLTHFFHEHVGNRPCKFLGKYPVWKNWNLGAACNSLSRFSSMAGTILIQARNPAQLGVELVAAIEERRFEDAWSLFEQYIHMDGFPRKSILNKVITGLAESLDHFWMQKAYGLVEMVYRENKHELLEKESLLYLSYVLARQGLPVPASTILRKVVQLGDFMPVSAWSGVIAHMSQNATGAYLAAELILEIGYIFQDNRVDPRKKCNRPLLSMKPDATAFSIALSGCLLFGAAKKAEELLEFMPRVGVKPDTGLLIVMAHVYERNGLREEIKKLRQFMEEASNISNLQIQQFYNCLLSCHLKFGDLDSASTMVLEILKKSKEACRSLSAANLVMEVIETGKSLQQSDHENPSFSVSYKLSDSTPSSYLEFCADRNFLKLETEAKEILGHFSAMLHKQVELVASENGILQPTERMYAKLVRAFLEAGKLSDLAVFLAKADKEDNPASMENSAFVHVINACISLGWLDQAYDLLDEMRFAGVRTGSSVYSSLLKAYCKENRPREIMSLLKDARKDGIQLDSSCYEALIQSQVLGNDTSSALRLFKEMKVANIPKTCQNQFEMMLRECADSSKPGLMAKLLEEIKGEQRVDCGVHDWNNVIHFFCKRRLMQDAQKALKKMQSLGHQPNAQTFHSMVTGYAALGGKYLEVTELWGQMKVLALSSSMKFDQELLDSLLYSFVRGGFFSRANEVVEMMEKEDMFIDKYKYRNLFLKYHKTLYKGKAPKFQTEAQCKRREATLSFKKWISLS